MNLGSVNLREATAQDIDLLQAAGLEAMNWTGEARFTAQELMSDPELSKYLKDWPRPNDFGAIAETFDGIGVGAAWCRMFTEEDAGYGFVAADIPELTIGVLPGHRGAGIGTALLERLIALASTRGLRAMSLSVEDGNPARPLYERLGFSKVRRNGGADTLQLDF